MNTAENSSLAAGNPMRRKALTAVALVVAVAGIAYGIYWALVLNHYEYTDNAYVQGNVVQLTPQVGGTVVAISVDDTDRVEAGQWLVRLDPADAEVALEQARAQLAQTVREVRSLYANNSTLAAQIALHEADLARAQAELAKAREELSRRTPLVSAGVIGKEAFEQFRTQLAAARSDVAAARSAVLAAREQLASNQTLTAGVAVAQHPQVLSAAARLREAYLALQRCELLAPVDGFVARRSVQLGERVAAGTPLLSLIALDRVWVEANFKESQLQNLRIGQPVELVADAYGNKVPFHGVVEGLGSGTGAAFALLPAQNATGNWIKVVQRLPVRVALDREELARHPLRVGLSMQATVDVRRTDGSTLAAVGRTAPAAQTGVFDESQQAADAEVRRIIVSNAYVASDAAPAAVATGPLAQSGGPDAKAVMPPASQRARPGNRPGAPLPRESRQP